MRNNTKAKDKMQGLGVNRHAKRDRSKVRFRIAKPVVGGRNEWWEWKPTQTSPMTRKCRNKARAKMQKASRKKNR